MREQEVLIIPADREGNKLFIKNYHKMNDRMFCPYKSTYNDMPYQDTELFFVDNNRNVTICGDDVTILWRFNSELLNKI
jgi:hypothetical protein